MPRPPSALIFDLDGTLIDSEPLHRRTWSMAFAEAGVALDAETQEWLQGRTGPQVIERLRAMDEPWAASFDPEVLIDRKRATYLELMPTELRAITGVDEFLRARKAEGVPLALVTSARLKLVGQIMLLFNWRNVFSTLVGVDHVSNPKPHPEPYLHACSRMKLRPADCLVFEDSLPGIESAVGAGARVCGVTGGPSGGLTERELRDAGARWVIDDFRDSAQLELALRGVSGGGFFGWLPGRRAARSG